MFGVLKSPVVLAGPPILVSFAAGQAFEESACVSKPVVAECIYDRPRTRQNAKSVALQLVTDGFYVVKPVAVKGDWAHIPKTCFARRLTRRVDPDGAGQPLRRTPTD
jgi:hypothetical protein